MLRPVLLALALSACAGKQPPPRSSIDWPEALDRTSTPETHREAALLVLDMSGVQAVMDRMVDVSLKFQLEQNPTLRPFEQVLRQFLSKYLSYEAIRDDIVQAYMERFDELQLRQIAAFYRTPTGKLAISKLAELAQFGAELGRKRVEEHQAELVEMLTKEMNRNADPPPSP